MINAVIVLSAVISMIVIFFIFYKKARDHEYSDMQATQNETIIRLAGDVKSHKARIIELEDGINKEYGVSIRQEITNVECIFTKLELIISMAGIYNLMNSPCSVDDKEAYIGLYKRIISVVEQMKDKEEK
ncbi:MAG TPA: hypothetical protein VMW95_09235 [Desulfobacterales bacterium]|nr:hypothetical protein [Desulfobacterales bacterium]